MAEFTLPKNSKIQSGKHYPAKDAKKPPVVPDEMFPLIWKD